MKFKRGREPKKAIGIGLSIKDDLKDHPVCSPMNDIWENVDPRDPDFEVYLNPNNQYCFNFGRFNEQDLRDWMEGRGRIVKGKTLADKKKYWEYAVFDAEKHESTHPRYLLKLTYKFWDRFQTDFNPHKHRGGMHMHIAKPLKVKRKTSDQLQQMINEQEVIIAMFAPYIDEIFRDLEFRDWQNIRHEYDMIFHGVKRVLYCQGMGYMGANNTPEEIQNLNWVTDIVYAKALYKFYEKTEVPMPDFKWLSERNHYDD